MKKVILTIVFLLAIIGLNACKSSRQCASVEKQEINSNQTSIALATD